MTSKGKLVKLAEELAVVALYVPQIPYDDLVLNPSLCSKLGRDENCPQHFS
jgi:hypothetical protein